MKLDYKRTIFVGFAFFLILAFWQAYDSIIPLILTNKKKGILEPEKRCYVLCHVCPECGYIELYAEKPKELKIDW